MPSMPAGRHFQLDLRHAITRIGAVEIESFGLLNRTFAGHHRARLDRNMAGIARQSQLDVLGQQQISPVMGNPGGAFGNDQLPLFRYTQPLRPEHFQQTSLD
ncbi:hypothetical protein FQZ97_933360 [compost metagenome]